MKRAWILLIALAALTWPRAASAQTGMFGWGFKGNGALLGGPTSLDARLQAAGRPAVSPLGGGLGFNFEGSYRVLRLSAGADWSFFGNDTVPVRRIDGFIMAGLRLRQGGWVVLPSLGFAYSTHEVCTKGPVGAVPDPRLPLFDQLISASGPQKCLSASGPGGRLELGIDREFWVGDDGKKDDPMVGLFVGARASLSFAFGHTWDWYDQSDQKVTLSGPDMPSLVPSLGLVIGMRIGK